MCSVWIFANVKSWTKKNIETIDKKSQRKFELSVETTKFSALYWIISAFYYISIVLLHSVRYSHIISLFWMILREN